MDRDYKSELLLLIDTYHPFTFTSLLKKNNKDIYDDILNKTQFIKKDIPFWNRCIYYLNDITEYPHCKNCGKICDRPISRIYSLKKLSREYHPFMLYYCSGQCCYFGEKSYKKSQNTLLRHYGKLYPTQVPEIRDKIKLSVYSKYGVSNVSKSPEIIEKIHQTFVKKYGIDNISQLNEIKEKVKKTNRDIFGVDYPAQNEEIKQKIKEVRLENRF